MILRTAGKAERNLFFNRFPDCDDNDSKNEAVKVVASFIASMRIWQ
jgi:hypothetical protein